MYCDVCCVVVVVSVTPHTINVVGTYDLTGLSTVARDMLSNSMPFLRVGIKCKSDIATRQLIGCPASPLFAFAVDYKYSFRGATVFELRSNILAPNGDLPEFSHRVGVVGGLLA